MSALPSRITIYDLDELEAYEDALDLQLIEDLRHEETILWEDFLATLSGDGD